jgi:hypothetical protein
MHQSRLLRVRRRSVGIALHVLAQFKISTDDRDFLHGNPRAFEPMNGIFGVGMMATNRHG